MKMLKIKNHLILYDLVPVERDSRKVVYATYDQSAAMMEYVTHGKSEDKLIIENKSEFNGVTIIFNKRFAKHNLETDNLNTARGIYESRVLSKKDMVYLKMKWAF